MPNGISIIQDFYKVAQDRDFLRKNQFRVLSINAGAGFNINFNTDDLVYAVAADLPNRTISMSEVSFLNLKFNIPGNVTYEGSKDYKITFYCDQKNELWSKFDEWTRQIFDDETSSGNYFAPKASATITLVQLDNNLNPFKKITLVGVVCKNVSPIKYDVRSNADAMTFDASLSYHFWVPENI